MDYPGKESRFSGFTLILDGWFGILLMTKCSRLSLSLHSSRMLKATEEETPLSDDRVRVKICPVSGHYHAFRFES